MSNSNNHSNRGADLQALDGARYGVLLAQQAQLAQQVDVDGVARHQRQRLPRHAKHLRGKGEVVVVVVVMEWVHGQVG